MNYVTKCGLRFNPTKTECVITGKNPCVSSPQWVIDNTVLTIVGNIEYLGATLGNQCGHEHTAKRIRSSRKSFFALQGAGLCREGLSIDASIHVLKQRVKMSYLMHVTPSI